MGEGRWKISVVQSPFCRRTSCAHAGPAWTFGLGMTFAMTIITNIGIRRLLPRTICLICLTLMWMESALGVCLGCRITL